MSTVATAAEPTDACQSKVRGLKPTESDLGRSRADATCSLSAMLRLLNVGLDLDPEMGTTRRTMARGWSWSRSRRQSRPTAISGVLAAAGTYTEFSDSIYFAFSIA